MEIIKATREDFEDVYKLDSKVEDFHIASNPGYLKKVNKEEKFKYWESKLENTDSLLLVAKINNETVGYMIVAAKSRGPFFKIKKWLDVDAMGVLDKCQKQGVGNALCEYLRQYAKDKNYKAIRLNVWEFNKGAQFFYEKQGFEYQSHNMELILEEQV